MKMMRCGPRGGKGSRKNNFVPLKRDSDLGKDLADLNERSHKNSELFQ